MVWLTILLKSPYKDNFFPHKHFCNASAMYLTTSQTRVYLNILWNKGVQNNPTDKMKKDQDHNHSLFLKAKLRIFLICFFIVFVFAALTETFHMLKAQHPVFSCKAWHFTNQTTESVDHFLMRHSENANQKPTTTCEKTGLSNLPSTT